MPSSPKRTSTRSLSYSDSEVLKADDPRPQRVAQMPTSMRRGTKSSDDRELKASYAMSTPRETPAAFLYVEKGPGAGQLMQIPEGTVVIGRASVADLRLQHPSVSRRHAQIRRAGSQFFVRDLGSQNGTYVNKRKIGTEVEIKPGDAIAVGNALMKLRGPMDRAQAAGMGAGATLDAPATRVKQKQHLPTSVVRRRDPGSSPLKVAMIAGLIGFIIAGGLIFVLVKTTTPGGLELRKVLPEAAKPKAAPEPENVQIELSDAVIKQEVTQALEKKQAERQAAAAAKADAEGKKLDEKGDDKSEKADKVASVSSSKKDKEKEAAEPKGGSKKDKLLAQYAKGDAEGALKAAKAADENALASRLSAFVAAHDAAKDALDSNNGTQAIRKFELALKIDQELGKGETTSYGTDIRKELSKLYTLVGSAFLDSADNDKALTVLRLAVKYDPSNKKAKGYLAKLEPQGASAAAAPAPAKSNKSAADAAFDDEAPAKKKAAPAKKPAAKKGSSIDDAFDE